MTIDTERKPLSMLRLISNDERRNHEQLLRSWLSGCDAAFVAVAFLKSSGLAAIKDDLIAFLNRGSSLRLLVGRDFCVTEPDALRVLLGLSQKHPQFEWRMVAQSPASTFHPKYYRFSGGGRIWVLTGSANLTSGGMSANIEVSAIAEDEITGGLAKEADRLEGSLWSNARCELPTEPLIGAYAAKFELNRKQEAKAAELIEQELREFPTLTGEVLTAELSAYRSSQEEQQDFAKRRANYQTARKMILDELLGARELTTPKFERIYESLVGSDGGTKLWHSGSVYRGKAEVMKQREDVVAMVREIAASLELSPEAMYHVGKRWMDRIGGVGPNIFTEFCNTLRAGSYAVLNDNPVTSLLALRIDQFPRPSAFKPEDYGRFCRCLDRLAKHCGFSDLGETDHFLNFVYWRHKEKAREESARNESEQSSPRHT